MIFDPTSQPTPIPPHPDLGKHICTRRYGRYYALAAALLLLVAALPVMLVAIALWPDPPTPTGRLHKFSTPSPPPPSRITPASIMISSAVILFIAGPLAYAAYRTGRKVLFRFDLWDHGVTVHRRNKPAKLLRYSDCTDFRFWTQRSYAKGIYAGSTVFVVFANQETRIEFDVPFKERPVGFSWTILDKTFECEDEMQLVRAVASASMADAWCGKPRTEFNWCNQVSITPDGFSPKRGLYAGRTIRFEDVAQVTAGESSVTLQERDHKKPFATLRSKQQNFWPGLEIARRLVPSSA